MKLPPLSKTPHLSRLLGPEETIIYTGKLHPIHGLHWLVGFAFFAGFACWSSYAYAVPAAICLYIYMLPFFNTEIAVTTHRLLMRLGRFHIHLYAIDAKTLDHYQLHQTPFSALNHYGTVILNLDTEEDMRTIILKHLWHPMTFLSAITTLNPLFRKTDSPKQVKPSPPKMPSNP